MTTEPNEIVEFANDAFVRLATKVVAFTEAYLFILETSVESYRILGELAENSDDPKPIEIQQKSPTGAMLRLTQLLKNNNTEFAEYFRSILFIDLISSTESYFSDLLRALIRSYPQKAGRIQFELVDILNSADKNEIVARAADVFVQRLMYEKPEDYLHKFCEVLAIEAEPLKVVWPIFIEAKARRDLGVHNNWICNTTYLRKAGATKLEITAKEGDKISPKDREYCDAVTAAVMEIAKVIHEQVVKKYA